MAHAAAASPMQLGTQQAEIVITGGMQQRANLARALAVEPKLLLMDEPFAALDAQTREAMQLELQRIWVQTHCSVVFVTHAIGEAVYLADTIYVLSHRPARILHQVDVPAFTVRDIALKSAPEFRAVEKKLLDLIYAPAKS